MLNKNVADYTNFDGKTNKKIVQAPGGASSISLAWQSSGNNNGNYRQNHNSNNNNYYNNGKNNMGGASGGIGRSSNDVYGNNSSNGGNNYYPDYLPTKLNSSPAYSYNSNKYGGEYGYGNNSSSANGMNAMGAMGGNNGYKYALDLQMKLKNSNQMLDRIGSGGSGAGSNNGSNLQSYGYHAANSNNLINQQINSINYGISKPPSYGNAYGGNGNGYGGYSGVSSNSNNNYNSYAQSNKNIDQLDLAYNQQYNNSTPNSYNSQKNKNKSYSLQAPPKNYQYEPTTHSYQAPRESPAYQHQQQPQYSFRPSVKINGPPPQQFSIGNADYNYWKDQEVDDIGRSGGRKIQSEKRIAAQRERQRLRERDRELGGYEQDEGGYGGYNQERTSVKVNNPPGGRQSLVLG